MFRGGQDHVKDANLKIWDWRPNGTMSEYGLANLPYNMGSIRTASSWRPWIIN